MPPGRCARNPPRTTHRHRVRLHEMENPGDVLRGPGSIGGSGLPGDRAEGGAIVETGAEEAITANPGLHATAAAGLATAGHGRGCGHVVDILDEAYAGGRRQRGQTGRQATIAGGGQLP